MPYTFTQRWIPELIENLEEVAKKDPNYKFLFDAQTLVVDDLLEVDRTEYERATDLMRKGVLEIGPYYAQIDQRLSSGESFFRNLIIGTSTVNKLDGSKNYTAWCVDLFGHISQSPQIHRIFGINSAFLWRGIPELDPFFVWEGADGSDLFVVALFAGGYRNFYKVTSIGSIALKRLFHEVRKLREYYELGHIPMFDGYDLDKEPGDAALFFNRNFKTELSENRIEVRQSSPYEYAEYTRQNSDQLPIIKGELLSGKYASIFPGTLSCRTYSKVLSHDTEQLLYRYAEPLDVISALVANKAPQEEKYELQTKQILQNLVHDVICGCSIDQVHEISEFRSKNITREMSRDIKQSIDIISQSLPRGFYAYSPTPCRNRTHIFDPDSNELYTAETDGVGIYRVTSIQRQDPVDKKIAFFEFTNSHYSVRLHQDGYLEDIQNNKLGHLIFRVEEGDTYWDSPGELMVKLLPYDGYKLCYNSGIFAQVEYNARLEIEEREISAKVQITFDESETIKFKIDLDTIGTGFSILFRSEYGENIENLSIGMPFDQVTRNISDTDLLPKDLPSNMDSLLVGQRDITRIFTFPFHGSISPKGEKSNALPSILAKGIKAYQTEGKRIVDVVLERSVDWIMKPTEHQYHTGDAGPKFYVPGAMCDRKKSVECAILMGKVKSDDISFSSLVDAYLTPPLIFEVTTSDIRVTNEPDLQIIKEVAPITSLRRFEGKVLARLYNPTNRSVELSKKYISTDPHGKEIGIIDRIEPKKIVSIILDTEGVPKREGVNDLSRIINKYEYPVGRNRGLPRQKNLTFLIEEKERLSKKVKLLEPKAFSKSSTFKDVHTYYVLAREQLEMEISYLWNQFYIRKLHDKNLSVYTVDDELYELAKNYNDLRIMRRMYDYIVDIEK